MCDARVMSDRSPITLRMENSFPQDSLGRSTQGQLQQLAQPLQSVHGRQSKRQLEVLPTVRLHNESE